MVQFQNVLCDNLYEQRSPYTFIAYNYTQFLIPICSIAITSYNYMVWSVSASLSLSLSPHTHKMQKGRSKPTLIQCCFSLPADVISNTVCNMTHMCMCVCACVYMRACVCVCVCVCVCACSLHQHTYKNTKFYFVEFSPTVTFLTNHLLY